MAVDRAATHTSADAPNVPGWARRQPYELPDLPDTREAYDRLLASIGDHADEMAPRPLVTLWPQVGIAHDGLLLVGQGLRGWPGRWQAIEARSPEGRQRLIESFMRPQYHRPDPNAWIDSSPYRGRPYLAATKRIVEGLAAEEDAPWYSRYAWTDLYPVAPLEPAENPSGVLKAVQRPQVRDVLMAVIDDLRARTIVCLTGWWAADIGADVMALAPQPRPLLRAGRIDGRTWVVGWHPQGARRQGWSPERYTEAVIGTVRRVETAGG